MPKLDFALLLKFKFFNVGLLLGKHGYLRNIASIRRCNVNGIKKAHDIATQVQRSLRQCLANISTKGMRKSCLFSCYN